MRDAVNGIAALAVLALGCYEPFIEWVAVHPVVLLVPITVAFIYGIHLHKEVSAWLR